MQFFIFEMEISAISEAAAGAVEIFFGSSSFCVEIFCGQLAGWGNFCGAVKFFFFVQIVGEKATTNFKSLTIC